MWQAKQACFSGTKAYKVTAGRDKGEPGDTKAKRRPGEIYQGRGRRSEVTGKVGYAKRHEGKNFQNKTGRTELVGTKREGSGRAIDQLKPGVSQHFPSHLSKSTRTSLRYSSTNCTMHKNLLCNTVHEMFRDANFQLCFFFKDLYGQLFTLTTCNLRNSNLKLA